MLPCETNVAAVTWIFCRRHLRLNGAPLRLMSHEEEAGAPPASGGGAWHSPSLRRSSRTSRASFVAKSTDVHAGCSLAMQSVVPGGKRSVRSGVSSIEPGSRPSAWPRLSRLALQSRCWYQSCTQSAEQESSCSASGE